MIIDGWICIHPVTIEAHLDDEMKEWYDVYWYVNAIMKQC